MRFRNGPGKACFHRRDAVGKVLAVKRQPSLDAKTVACAKPDQHDVLVSQQLSCKVVCKAYGYRDLETVFAGITRARNNPAIGQFTRIKEVHCCNIEACFRQNSLRLRALQGQKHPLQHFDCHIASLRIGTDMGEVLLRAGRVANDHEAIGCKTRDNQVIDDASLLIEEEGVARLAWLLLIGRIRTQMRDEGGCILPRKHHQHHV